MGTWALPNTTEKAEQLKKLMEKPLKANGRIIPKLYYLYGDDDLFDAINERKEEYGKNYDLRFLVASYINFTIEYYKSSPEAFYLKFEKKALKILEQIVKEQGV